MTATEKTNIPAPSNKIGDHPLGGALGAALGAIDGAVVAGAVQGAALGTVAGLPGMAAGVAIGGVIGALVGKEVAQQINLNAEEAYWRDNHEHQAYFNSTARYDAYAPAYRYGIEAFSLYGGRAFDEVAPQIAGGWEGARGSSRLTWETAQLATRDAYNRLSANNPRTEHAAPKAVEKTDAELEEQDKFKIWQ
ncbi:MAG: hypothetical protein EBR02_00145 [Alphaproteobacteria bacterium]|nr:hypothetical protein [Alphaproteobacteria bacterium]